MSSHPDVELSRLVEIMRRLRAEGGCPWDREQDLRSLRPYLVEETFEVLDEMDRVGYGGSWKPYCEELGDLLFQIVFHAQLASELKEFTMADVCRAISDKIESRHPHVFGDAQVKGAEQVLANWAQLKAEERKKKHGSAGSVLDGVPSAAPALLRAERLTEKASRIGFDWPTLREVRAKLDEELSELDEAISEGDRDELEHELGDVLFSLANLARFIKTPAEDALRQANRRFIRRFGEVEAGLLRDNVPFGTATLEQMDVFWNEAKKKEHLLPPPRETSNAHVHALVLPSKEPESLRRFYEPLAPILGWQLKTATPAPVAFRLDVHGLHLDVVSADVSCPMQLRLDAPSRKAVEGLHEKLIQMGVSVRGAPVAGPEGFAFTFLDCENNLLTYAFREHDR